LPISKTSKKLYGNMKSGIADEIAFVKGDTVYIVDSGWENGKIEMGVRDILPIPDASLRNDFVRRNNNDAISKGRVSDGLSSRIKRAFPGDRSRDLRQKSGSELQADKGKSENQQKGVSGENANKRGLSGKAIPRL